MEAAFVGGNVLGVLQALTRISHALSIHTLTFEQVQVHFSKPVVKHGPEQLRIFETIVFLREEGALAILFRPARTEDIAHAQRYGGGIVLQETFLDREVDTTERLDISLGRTLRSRSGRAELIGILVYRQLGLGLIDRGQLYGEIGRQLEITIELAEIAP